MDSAAKKAWIQIPALQLPSCVTLSSTFTSVNFNFLIRKTEIIILSIWMGWSNVLFQVNSTWHIVIINKH